MLNENIRIDLHIHSKISEYKEDPKIVQDSTKENLPILLDKLAINKISMFAFSDHNRFDKELFLEAKKLITTEAKYEQIKCNLPSVEFDVKIEDGKSACHILTVFNYTSEKDLDRIVHSIDKRKLTDKAAFYDIGGFEELLKDISLDTILIASQRKSLTSPIGSTTSLSDSASDPYEYLLVGYIDALEYQKPHVEGILMNNLSEFPRNIGLLAGSDCHQWNVYPLYNEKDSSVGKEFYSTIKSLPSYMGLLMALTSPKSRFKRAGSKSHKHIKSFSLNGTDCELSNGVNAIIGENGSGKSSLIYGFLNEISSGKGKYAAKILKDNEFVIYEKVEIERVKAVRQSELLENNNKSSFIFGDEDDYFGNINNSDFEERINEYAVSLFEYIESKIAFQSSLQKLANQNFEFSQSHDGAETFYISFYSSNDFTNVVNPHESRLRILNQIIKDIKKEIDSGYYSSSDIDKFDKILVQISEIRTPITTKYRDVLSREKIKNIINNKLLTYNSDVKSLSTTLDTERMNYAKSRENLIDSLLEVVRKMRNTKSRKIEFPKSFNGISNSFKNGYIFRKITLYHQADLEVEFYKTLFRKEYPSFSEIDKIDTKERFADAIFSAKLPNYVGQYNDLVSKFISKLENSSKYILEAASSLEMGSTLGEMSLVYYKYQTYQDGDWDILIIDQPEDNISNLKISENLVEYLNKLRDEKQIVFVTHNPLLVVNLDVDNVVYLQKINNKIKVTSGCLEDESNKIIDIVAKNMDGGRETLERRLRIYGKK